MNTDWKHDTATGGIKRWLDKDFTWQGLKSITNDSGQTLHDYWTELGKANPDVLDIVSAKHQPDYHIVHLPLYYADGTPTLKITHPDDARARLNRILAYTVIKPPRQIGKARLSGAVLFHAPSPKVLTHADLEHAIFTDHVDLSNVTIDCQIYLDNVVFMKEVTFTDTNFEHFTNFQSCEFRGDLDFKDAIFKSDAGFLSTNFRGQTQFMDTIFEKNIHFTSSTFHGEIYFNCTSFIENGFFWNSIFFDKATFQCAKFKGACFNDSVFKSDVDLSSITVNEMARFERIIFESKTIFTTISFLGEAHFSDTAFKAEGLFNESIFHLDARFERVTFEGTANFESAKFKNRLTFSSARFKKHAVFKNISWPWHEAWTRETLSHHLSAFDQAVFSDTADFSGSGCTAFGAFDGARFKEGIKFDDIPEKTVKHNFKRELWPVRFVTTNSQFFWAYIGDLLKNRIGKGEVRFDRPDNELRAIENGCRVLKKEMAGVSDKRREQLFYQFELMAQREQRSVSPIEFLASIAYEYVSDYGSSILRPMAFLFLGVLPLFAIFYWLMLAAAGPLPCPPDQSLPPVYCSEACAVTTACRDDTVALSDFKTTILRSVNASASRIFPFGAFEGVSKSFAEDLTNRNRPDLASLYMFTSAFQTFLCLILVFLTSLAVRRRFQING